MIQDGAANCVFLAALLQARHPELFAQLHSTLISHGVEVRLLNRVRDIWAMDYCPLQTGPGQLVKFRYHPDYLHEHPELRTGDEVVEAFRACGNCHRSAIILDAGNVVTSGSKAILTDKVYKENPNWSRANLRKELQQLLQVDRLILIPKEPYDPIGHADGMVRFIDDDTVLVNDYLYVDPDFGNRLLAVLRRHKLAIETLPYSPEQGSRDGIPSAVGCYTNFLRTEHVVILPSYGTAEDHLAKAKLEAVFPRIPVVSLDCTALAGEGGVLHCIAATYHVVADNPSR